MESAKQDRYIFVEQVNLLVKHIPSMIWLTLLTGAVIALILVGKVPDHIPALWFLGVLTYCGVRFWHYHSLKKERVTVDNMYGHGLFFVGFSFIAGTLWGILGIILPILSNPYLMVLTAILLCGMVAGSVSFLSIYKPAYFAFAIPCVAPFSVRAILAQDEIPVAIGVLLLMFLAINLLHSHLAQANVLKGIHLVLENRELIEQLKREKEKAEEARQRADHNNQAKSRFLAAASHDLRQPLHAMGFFAEALSHEQDADKISTLAQKIVQTSDALRNLLGSLLDISRIEAGVMAPQRTHFILNDLLTDIFREYAAPAHAKGLHFTFTPCVQAVYSDRQMLNRILRNLISNAIRYTDSGFVTVSWEHADGRIVVRVSDSGIGIPETHRREIFNEFFQVGQREGAGARGLGLGLSIVDGLCRLLEHELTLASDTGVGSVFSVRIPLGNVKKVVTQAVDQVALAGDVVARILILNKEDEARESMREIMGHWGHEVLGVRTGAEAMTVLRAGDFLPDLIISDLELADSPGAVAVAAIEEKLDRKIPAIFMTGDGKRGGIEKIRAQGFSVLQKPVQPAKLRSMVSYLVQGNT